MADDPEMAHIALRHLAALLALGSARYYGLRARTKPVELGRPEASYGSRARSRASVARDNS